MDTTKIFKENYHEFQLKMTQLLAQSERPDITSFPFFGEEKNYLKEYAQTLFLGAVGCVPTIGALLCNVVGFIFFPPSSNTELWDSIASSVKNIADGVQSNLNNARINGMVESIKGDFNKYFVAKNAYENKKNKAIKEIEVFLKKIFSDEIIKKISGSVSILGIENKAIDEITAIHGFTESDFEKVIVSIKKITNATIPNNYRDDYLKQYDDLEDELLRKLSTLLNSPNETKFHEIGAFAILATTHLFVLKDGIKNGKIMGMTDEKIQFYVEIYNSKLPIYYEHIRSAYNIGVELIKNLPDLKNHIKYTRYLNYRNYCAQFVFDNVETWSCLDDIYPNGVYRENVRYLWDYAGFPVDSGKEMKLILICGNGDYYQPSIDTMNKWMEDSGIERYKGELTNVDATYDEFFFINVQPSFLDETKPGLIRPEAVVGGNNSNTDKTKKAPTKKATIPPGNKVTGYSVSSDILPRELIIIPNVDNNFVSFTPRKSWAIQRKYDYKSYNMSEELVPFIETKDKTYAAHKLSTVTGKGSNKQIHDYDYFEYVDPGYDGLLDSLFFGFQPCNLFNDNYLFSNQATMVNAQKTHGIPVDGVSLARDHVLPTVHSILVTKTKSLPFKFKYLDENQVTKTYEFGIRYHSTTPVEISVRNAGGVVEQLAMTLKPCTSDGKGTNEYKTQFAKTKVDLTKPRLTIFAVNKKVYIHSIILIPSKQ
ncbi:hypothetical protein ACTFIZ_010807 [Dictyostelium cf. discoideum]